MLLCLRNIQNKKTNMQKSIRWRLMAISLLGAGCGSVMADDYPTEQDYLQELPIVLSASRLAQPISETPNAMTVISRDMIKASGLRNIADLFKLVPGMYVGYSDGHTPVVSYHGATDAFARRMQVLVDGRTIYLPLFGQVDWAELPLDIGDIERIEVIRGPSAASHGSNSVQGVISIYTRQASGVPKTQLSINRGDAAISDNSIRWGSVGENWDYRVTLASRADNGFDTLNDTSNTQLFNTRINYRPTSSDSLDFQLGYSNTWRANGLLDMTPHNQMNTTAQAKDIIKPSRDQKVNSEFQQLTWLHTIHKNNDIQFSYYHIGRNMKDDRYSRSCADCNFPLNLASPGSYLIADDAVIHRHELELQHTLNTSATNRVVWGIGMRSDSVDAPNTFLNPITWKEYRMFAHDEWRATPASLLNIGAMAEKNALGQARVSPRIAYSHHLSPLHTLRAGISVAYRNPEMIEESGNRRFLLNKVGATQYTFNDILAAGGLSPERTISREVGYFWQLDKAGSSLDIRAYHDQITDIIWIDPAASATSVVTPSSFMSDFNAFYSGLEGALNYKLGVRSNLTINYAHQVAGASPSRVASNATVNAALIAYAQNYSQTVPLNSASLLFSHEFSDGMQFGAGFYHQDPVKVLDVASAQPLMRRLDLRVAKRFGASRNKARSAEPGSGEIALVIQNALSDHYTDYKQEIVGKRRAYLTATLEF